MKTTSPANEIQKFIEEQNLKFLDDFVELNKIESRVFSTERTTNSFVREITQIATNIESTSEEVQSQIEQLRSKLHEIDNPLRAKLKVKLQELILQRKQLQKMAYHLLKLGEIKSPGGPEMLLKALDNHLRTVFTITALAWALLIALRISPNLPGINPKNELLGAGILILVAAVIEFGRTTKKQTKDIC